MAGTWNSQNKVLPGCYINFKTNEPLSIMPGDRGIVVILQEMSVGTEGDMYAITATDVSEWPENATAADKFLTGEALKLAQKVIVYNLGIARDSDAITAALTALKTVIFNTLCYPYDSLEEGSIDTSAKTAINTWIEAMRSDEGIYCQAVLANHAADSEAVINVANGVKMVDGTTLTAAQCTAWVAGATAGAYINQSNTNQKYIGAVDVSPRMTKTEMETAINAGKFIFKVDTSQNVTAVYDINSFITFTADKAKSFRKNRTVRVIDNINNDVTKIFEANYMGKINNNEEGRSLLKASLVEYFKELQRLQAIQNFVPDDVTVTIGADKDAVVIDCYIQTVDSAEKFYITVNLR
ncbi:phage tail sheath protein [Sporanaerobium hydrogeniformans]|uniref:Phage tail sheath protein n=1 Tax=Sporanaerobium hydrogeniformans TaxID=3072179 RepID=A0AC61DG17_9FIRM|nr:phage tail sheath subtilisin-like domain-containing protein [Sporanaerobium hydrogeniformans]PHV72184.1 phage tail sheath protein [Sporanaerobium hydrogeniformans]